MRRAVISLSLVAVIALAGPAAAQEAHESLGEDPLVLAAFYECKPGPLVNGVRTWREVTTLMFLGVGRFGQATLVTAAFFDGHGNGLAKTQLTVATADLDEVNVCRTIEAAGIVPAPQAGSILIFGPTSYCWMKNLLGKFSVNVNEPFNGRVDGIAKTECRVVPSSAQPVQGQGGLIERLNLLTFVSPILIEGTADED